MYDNIVELISNVGFPVAVSVYLLVRIEKKLDDLIKAFNDFTKK
ncbi:YvrJ family protein [Clostridium sporogenes]|uniref:YvrJ family protein n=1 Tax=Clostridium botulinum TaxID=1491 RepID=A0A6M0SU81_CLOBO|nr:YvrJ family protein [Clostridium botulinum]NFI73019.1 YvrJ family protein [Clostridium sporogenes]NFL71330.1 YvrJ family protein [Clostridium sporogenes]NFM23060.1 YvrJ family protein [Clostridium sporogenes]NFP60432.1 YvrJ family protein [Clostridium sporogenes]